MPLVCKTCETEKPDDEMVVRRGNPIRLCKVCLGNSIRGKRGGGNTSKKRRAAVKRKASRKEAPPELTADELEVLPGAGFKSFLTEDDRLQINQGADNVVLSKTELKVLSAQYAPWADAPNK